MPRIVVSCQDTWDQAFTFSRGFSNDFDGFEVDSETFRRLMKAKTEWAWMQDFLKALWNK